MTLLDEIKKKKKTLKSGVMNLVQRARGYMQGEDNTLNEPIQPVRGRSLSPVQERPPTPDMSDWDFSEEEEVPAEEKRRRRLIKHHSADHSQRMRQKTMNPSQKTMNPSQKTMNPSQKRQEAGRTVTKREEDVERKMSLNLGPTTSGTSGKGQMCSSESEHLRVRGSEPQERGSGKGKRHSSKRAHRVCPDVPAWQVQQWCENFGDKSAGIHYKRQLSPIPARCSEKDRPIDEMARVPDTPRPKCNYRKSRVPKTSPMKPQHPIRAAGFTTRNREPDVPARRHQQLTETSGPKIDNILGLDEEIPSFIKTAKWRKSRQGAGETSRADKVGLDIGYGRRGNMIVEYCTSGESSRSMRTVSPQVGSEGDPLDGLDDLLTEVERIETDIDQRRTAPRTVPSTQRRSESSQSWSSKENNPSAVNESVCGPVERMRRQRADRRRELEVMDQLLEELVCSG